VGLFHFALSPSFSVLVTKSAIQISILTYILEVKPSHLITFDSNLWHWSLKTVPNSHIVGYAWRWSYPKEAFRSLEAGKFKLLVPRYALPHFYDHLTSEWSPNYPGAQLPRLTSSLNPMFDVISSRCHGKKHGHNRSPLQSRLQRIRVESVLLPNGHNPECVLPEISKFQTTNRGFEHYRAEQSWNQ
jgi:hypothetical protein